MIYVNNKEKLNKIKNEEGFYVITDFDRTLTTKTSEPSMGIVPHYLGGECLKERTKIFEYYRPIELDYTLDNDVKQKYMREWANASFTLLSKYVTEEVVHKSLEKANLYLRDGAKEFLEDMNSKKIPVIIMSSGIGNIVEGFLEKENCLFENIMIVSNFFEFSSGKTKIDFNNLIATSTKEYKRIPKDLRYEIEKRKYALLFGDLVEDIKMINKENLENTLTFGFLDTNVENNLQEFNKNFDVVLTYGETFKTINKLLNVEWR